MNIVAVFDPGASTGSTFAVPQNEGKMVVWNESNISLQLSFQNGYTAYVAAWTAVLFCGPWGSGTATWQQQTILNASSPPLSQVVVEVYAVGEAVPGTFPMALTRQSNIGNTVSTALGGSTSLQNDGNIQTVIIESTPSGAPSSTISIDNQGNVTIKGNNAGTLTTLLQLVAGASPAVKIAAAAIIAEVLGGLKIDGTLESVGAAKLDSTLSVTGASALDGGAMITDGSGGITSNNKFVLDGNQPTINYNVNNGVTLQETGGANGFVIGRTSGNSTPVIAAINNSGGIGFKRGGIVGTKIAEIKNNGNFVIAGTSYGTTSASTPTLNSSQSFDGFDFAEVFPIVQKFPGGTVVCPGADGLLHTCTHDACPYAMVVSQSPAFCAGGARFDDDQEPHEDEQKEQAIALCGRIIVPTKEAISFRQWVTSNGRGGIRRLEAGEFALGYALADSTPDGRVLIFLRSI